MAKAKKRSKTGKPPTLKQMKAWIRSEAPEGTPEWLVQVFTALVDGVYSRNKWPRQ